MTSPREYDCGRYAEGYGGDDEGVSSGMGCDEFILRDDLVVSLRAYVISVMRGGVDTYFLHNLVERAVLRLSVGGRQCRMKDAEGALSAVWMAVVVAVEDCLCLVVERDGEGVAGLLGGEGDVVAVDVGFRETEDVGRTEACVTAEKKHVL